jgi:hypothetical protein
MKYYYTLLQPLNTTEQYLTNYFDGFNIKYKMSVDFVDFVNTDHDNSSVYLYWDWDTLKFYAMIYTVMMTKEDLLALQLTINAVRVIKTQLYYRLVNKFRNMLKWILS